LLYYLLSYFALHYINNFALYVILLAYVLRAIIIKNFWYCIV